MEHLDTNSKSLNLAPIAIQKGLNDHVINVYAKYVPWNMLPLV